MAKTPSKVAKRYARALFESIEPAKLEEALSAMNTLSETWEQNENLRAVLTNPGVVLAERASVLTEIAKRAGEGQPLIANFLQLLLENGRIALLPEMAAAFSGLVDLLKKRLALEITSAFDIDGGERDQILDQVRRDFGGLASIQWNTDPQIIGGLRIQAGDMLLDGSIAGALAGLRESLTQ